MNYFPAFLNLEGRSCLMVGGGAVAARKLRRLLKAGAEIVVVAPELADECARLNTAGRIEHKRRGFRAGDVRGHALVISATGDTDIDTRVSAAAREAGVPVNVVDDRELSTFITPAVIERDPVVIGISSGGAAPVLVRRIRAMIEGLLPARIGRLAMLAADFRNAVKANIPDIVVRRRFWDRFFDGALARDVLAGRETSGRERMLALVNRPGPIEESAGRVTIVGAGPGDPDLLTLKALQALQQADVVVYDRLVAPGIVDYARRDAERIYVGKSSGRRGRTQDEINRLLRDHACRGRHVVRLKGGDPLIFGRGGEERDFLRHSDIAVEMVPGITAASGCGAAAGIPLTHRDFAHAVTFVTGHTKDGDPGPDWQNLARLGHTLVVYMGVAVAGEVADRLISFGMAASTPVAVIENGTTAEQRVFTGTLRGLGALIAGNRIGSPALVVIGEVAGLADAAPAAEIVSLTAIRAANQAGRPA
jgi:uroporphyrin-III C-methyltransferase/precorrin-2 dehydrogenase/sirohydrochlorin ferrochelatase